jgi:hypothetical protein
MPSWAGVEHGAVALDEAGPFHFLHPAQAGGGGQAHAFGQDQVGDPAIAAQFRNIRALMSSIFVICCEICALMRCICNPCGAGFMAGLRHDI